MSGGNLIATRAIRGRLAQGWGGDQSKREPSESFYG